jgi:hypothetical protein
MSSNDNNSSSSNNNNNAGSSGNNNSGNNNSGNNNSNKNAGDYPAAPLAPLPPTGLSKEVYLKVMADLGAEPAEWHGEAEIELARQVLIPYSPSTSQQLANRGSRGMEKLREMEETNTRQQEERDEAELAAALMEEQEEYW